MCDARGNRALRCHSREGGLALHFGEAEHPSVSGITPTAISIASDGWMFGFAEVKREPAFAEMTAEKPDAPGFRQAS